MAILRYDVGTAQARIALAAIGEQEIDEAPDAAIIGGVKDVTTVLSRADEARPQKLFQMKRHGRRRNARRLRKRSGGNPARARPDEALKDVEANLLRKGRKRGESSL
jgi:hypothetical protein